jgi:LuxR family maltose regulon positive regulatory protein
MLCFAAAMVASHTGSVDAAEGWLDAAERAPVATGKEPDFTVLSAALRAWLRLLRGDIEGTIAAARQASGSSPGTEPGVTVAPLLPLGAALWWSQRLPEATTVLQAAAGAARSARLDAQTIFAVGFDAAAAFDDQEMARAQALVGEAADLTRRSSLDEHPFSAMARVVSGRMQALRGELRDAAEQIERGIQLADRAGAWHISVYGLLALAELRQLEHSPTAARRLITRARARIEALTDPGAGLARVMLAETKLRMQPAAGRDTTGAPLRELSERELAVLRRLPSSLSQRELAAELYVSVNTVKTQVRAIFDKLGVTSRAEAVARARELGLL